ncbi:MAG TPA: DMT family transporter [Vicinamibacterales bacterium]|jgi:drug/metabolite transporter (DMT)-like permease|nr:EamA family transporter [Acidobacteriota bacterium]MDP7472273.1 DMT family transporter [Vicinamibacterales bacterium]HJO37614.1 DMT family transporter [Vicinamibacterales bacterium]
MENDPSTQPATNRRWLFYAIVTTLTWGVWGALIEIPEQRGFPATLGYSVWALTMVPCATLALRTDGWRLARHREAWILGGLVGFLGAGGQLILFEALRSGPAFIVFPVVSLYPAVAIVLSVWLLSERASRRSQVGIALAIPAIASLSYVAPDDTLISGYVWLVPAFGVFMMWGIQAYVMKHANARMPSESIFFYMMLTGVLLVPIALWMTDFTQPINYRFDGPFLAALIHVFNAVGALCLVYALRDGKAIIVVPMTALAPVITIVLSLAIYARVPSGFQLGGMSLAVVAIYLMAE